MALLTQWQVKQNDTREPIVATLQDSNGTPYNLSSLAVSHGVKFIMRLPGPGPATPKVDADATVVDAANGIVKYQWVTGDTDTVGTFNGEFQVTFLDGRILTFPNTSYLTVNVVAELGS